MAGVGKVADALVGDELGAGEPGELLRAIVRHEVVLVALHDQQRKVDALEHREDLVVGHARAVDRVDERLAVGVQRPADRVLDLLRRVRLAEALGHEELEVVAVVARPVVPVGLRPAVVGLQIGVEREADAGGHRRRERKCGRHEDRAAEAVAVVGAEQQSRGRGAAVHDHRAVVDAGGVEHRNRVALEHARAVGVRGLRPIRAAVAARVERHDAEVARQVRDLRLPEARVDDRPRREQQDRLVALAEDVVRDADAIDVGEAAALRQQRALTSR